MIRISNLNKRFGRQQVLRQVELEIPPGRIVGLVGENGAGKTTLLKCMLGMLHYNGDISVLGKSPDRQRLELLQEVAWIPDVNVLPDWMTPDQLTNYVRLAHPAFNEVRYARLLDRSHLPLHKKVRKLSKGMKAKLYLLLVLSLNSRVLILDEPTLGLDIIFRKEFFQTILQEFATEDCTILISTHQVEEVESTLSDVVFIREGSVQLHESLEQLHERFRTLTLPADQSLPPELPAPLYSTTLLGNQIHLFENVAAERLSALGQVGIPSLADIFLALNRERIS